MKSLESLERETPEFTTLTPEQQKARREMLRMMLFLLRNKTAGLTREEGVIFACDLLEFHLTGKIDKIPVERKTI